MGALNGSELNRLGPPARRRRGDSIDDGEQRVRPQLSNIIARESARTIPQPGTWTGWTAGDDEYRARRQILRLTRIVARWDGSVSVLPANRTLGRVLQTV
jgi:hypothetical protein